ncbi:hypothetical protein Moror_2241 [Moniliophthora roreri MCA 2997]|uniref:Uncharacterized protein n=2 Tax=Moniliophthora roreri TaxID=221103 RepID=V2WL60_MONRO|nr:hypothetical protein Moror_2241 [Moniliophthora roreri MCA 2997]KAI3605744.1 hypothetical protein WG66_012035 [Moniliophthora roreri]
MVPTSRFTSLLDTNFAPNPEEVNEIRDLLHEPEKELHVLEEQISRLRARRDELKSFVNRHRALLSPIRQIPRDVLEEIMIHCLPINRFPICSSAEPPLLLTAICRSWREIALSTPHLWNTIHINLPPALRPELNDTLASVIKERSQGVQRWLNSSGSLPLTFSLHTNGMWHIGRGNEVLMESPQFGNTVLGMYRPFVEMLMAFSSRWEHAVFSQVPPSVMEIIGTLEENAVSQLKFLRLVNCTDPSDSIAVVSNLMMAPKIQSLYLCGYVKNPLHYPAPWKNLTELEITRPVDSRDGIITQHVALEILARCSQRLESIVLDIRPTHEHPHSHIPMIDLPHLRELDLEFYQYTLAWTFVGDAPDPQVVIEAMETVFDAINVPALTSLGVKIDGLKLPSAAIREPPPFVSLIERCKCDLLYLSLFMPLPDQVFLEHLLPLVPSLTVLKVTDWRYEEIEELDGYLDPRCTSSHTITERLLQGLATQPCQELEEVHFISVNPSIAELLFQFARDRQWALRVFKVDFCHFVEGDEAALWVNELKKRGIKVRWRSPGSQLKRLKGEANEGFVTNSFPFHDISGDPNTGSLLEVIY